jgi:transposase
MYQITLEPAQIRHAQVDFINGVSVDAIAERYGVSRRTIYRFLSVRLERVRVEGWAAWFALSDKKAPQRLTTWEPAK